ncbi:MAG: hypothetical protein GC161_10000 [Planctomycetaceae bacterium]|nr:hypothetical protein [Planctomycetaceae bacterium]
MPIALAIGFALFSAVLGFFAARQTLVARHRRELEAQGRRMTAAVEERFGAYLELEGKVRRLLARLDQLETQTTQDLARTGMRLRNLDSALSAAGLSAAPTEAVAAEPEFFAEEALSWMDETPSSNEVIEVRVGEEQSSNRTPAENLDLWEQRIEDRGAQQRAQMQAQERLVEELTARIESLQSRLGEREVSPAVANAAELRQECEIWRERHLELERTSAEAIARVRARAEQAGELESDLSAERLRAESLSAEVEEMTERLQQERAESQRRFADLQTRLTASEAQHGQKIRDLEQRIGELQPFVERESAALSELEHWRATAGELKAELRNNESESAASIAQLAGELEETRGRLERELENLEGRRVDEVRHLESRLDELEGLRPDLEVACARVQELGTVLAQREDDLAALEASRAEWERKAHSENDRAAEFSAALDEARGQVEHWRERFERAEAEREARVSELDRRLVELESLSELLREATDLHLGRIAELEQEEQRLEHELLERTESLTSTRERLTQAEQTLETVSRLLRESNAKS